MSKLRDLLNKQKDAKPNVQQQAAPVLQPKTEPAKAEVKTAAEPPKKLSLLEQQRLRKLGSSASQIRGPETSGNNSVLGSQGSGKVEGEVNGRHSIHSDAQSSQENITSPNNESVQHNDQSHGASDNQSQAVQEPPPGLTGFALKKWRMAHAAQKTVQISPDTAAKEAGNLLAKSKEAVSQVAIPAVVSENVAQDKLAQISVGTSAAQQADAQKSNAGSVQVQDLKNNLKYLADNIENKDIVANIVRTIAMQVANHPEIGKSMTRGDVNLMVRGLRMSYQTAAMSKQVKAEKKGKSDVMTDQLSQMIKDMGMNFKI